MLSYMEMDDKSQDWEEMDERWPVETSVGTLVWVRRRNGHWWPGRVLAAHEVPRSHLLVPKSGTPVKLLGKDDASVDWYNLGKSRRIKAFRCGEFDDCIERARSFGSLRSKNREKYARRDDAILHALELEKMQAQGRLKSDRLFSVGTIAGFPDLPKYLAFTDDKRGSSHLEGQIDTMPSTDATTGALSFSQATRHYKTWNAPHKLESSTPLDWENGNSEVIPRMRDLQDIGFTTLKGSKTKCRNVLEPLMTEDGIGISKGGKLSCKNALEAMFLEDGNIKMESCITRVTPGVCPVPSNSKLSAVTVQKRKTCPSGSSADESSYKKRYRQRPLVQVMKKSSNKKVSSGGGSSVLPSSTANCHMRMYWSDGTEATSSQEPFQQAANDFRPCPEPREFHSVQGAHQSSCGVKQEACKPLVESDRGIPSFWPNYWDGCRWPSMVSAQMDFGLLLGSTYVDSIYEGTKPGSRLPGMACTGSATSVNKPYSEMSDSLKYLYQPGMNFSNSGQNTCNSMVCEKKEVQDSDLGPLGVCVSSGLPLSKWQVKGRRKARKSSLCLKTEQEEDIDHYGTGDIVQDLEFHAARHRNAKIYTGSSTYMKPLRHMKMNPWASYYDTPWHSIRSGLDNRKSSLQVCHVRRIPKSRSLNCYTHRPAFGWVDVRVDFCKPNRRESTQLVALYSEMMNRVVSGYPIPVQDLERRVKYEASAASTWSRGKQGTFGRISSTRVTRCPTRRTSKQKQGSKKAALRIVGRKLRRCKPLRRSGSTLQKTRTLSSLGGDEGRVRTEPKQALGCHEAAPCDVSKGSLVTCIPVHVVFQRIREVLYKQPDHIKNCDDHSEP